MRIWIDVEDLFEYFTDGRRPSGIQRLVYELASALRAQLGNENVRFLRRNVPDLDFNVVPWSDVDQLFNLVAASDALPHQGGAAQPAARRSVKWRQFADRLAPELRFAVIRAGRALGGFRRASAELLRAGGVVIGRLPRQFTAGLRRGPNRRPVSIVEAGFAPGDVIAVLGSPWLTAQYSDRLARARARHGARVAILIYDLIPILHSEWCDPGLARAFDRWIRSTLPQADLVMAISRSTARDVEQFARENAVALARPVVPLPVGTGFGLRQPAAGGVARRAPLPAPGSYVLLVGTIEARKNHVLLFRVWRRLLADMPRDEVPTLVFAGREGWLVQDFMQQLRNTNFLDGKIEWIDNPSDRDLKELYKGCLFTVFPSLYEGWGLPVTESLGLGRPCIISSAASLPEAGGIFARYFDPESPTQATAVIRSTLEDRPGLAAWRRRIEREFRPVAWEATATTFLDELDALSRPRERQPVADYAPVLSMSDGGGGGGAGS